MSEESIPLPLDKFFVVGLITSDEFQKCRFIVNKLQKSFPKQYAAEVRAMLNVQWEDYLIKIKRNYGNGLWALNKSVVVFLNEEYLGDDEALFKFISKKFRFSLKKDWYEIGKCHLAEYLGRIVDKFRQLAYITVSINHRVIGTMLFELYNDLVPLACENFLTRCKLEEDGYVGTPIHRILKNSWIQCGGWNLNEKQMPCENYVVPHNRRGVLCTCNNGRHNDNTTQFFITLAPTPWMDYRYVAFGQLIQGAEVLKQIEEVPTYYQSPQVPIDIVKAGEIIFNPPPDFVSEEEYSRLQNMEPLLETLIDRKMGKRVSSGSLFSMRKFKLGHYCLPTDMRSYLPYWSYSRYLLQDAYPEGDYDYSPREFDIPTIADSDVTLTI